MLFSPPLSSVPVTETIPIVIRRQAQYELAISHSDVSRQNS
jgi:hypothetical protein